MTAFVYLDTHHHVGMIDRRLFSGFLEHLGRAVYEGVYDPGNPLSDAQGFRRDVLEALRPLAMPLIRYPGGNYVSCHDWKDGVGPREQRPRRPDFAWKSIETNQFGTDEFMAWCQQLQAEAMMAVNLGTGSLDLAAQLVEYCNLPGGTLWSDRRQEYGHAAPYGVKLWCLGNEMDGPWQAGHCPAEVYAQRAAQASTLMKGLDPTIQTVACGSSSRGMGTYLHWDRTVLEHCWDHVDYISAHRYSGNPQHDTPAFLAEGVEIERILEDYTGLLNYVRGVKRSSKRVYLSFDEWNVWYKGDPTEGQWKVAPHLLEEVYNLEDALVCAQYLNAFIRRADVVKVACIAQIVNVIAPILTRREGVLLQPTYYPFMMLSRLAHGRSLVPVLRSPTYQAGSRGEAPALDVAAAYEEQSGHMAVSLVNRQAAENHAVTVRLADRKITGILGVEVLTGADVKQANTWEQPAAIKPAPGKATSMEDGSVQVVVPGPGLTVLHLETAAR